MSINGKEKERTAIEGERKELTNHNLAQLARDQHSCALTHDICSICLVGATLHK